MTMDTHLKRAFVEHWEVYEGVLSDKNEKKTEARRSRAGLGRFGGNQIAYTEHRVRRNYAYSDSQLAAALKWLLVYNKLEATSEALVRRFPSLFPPEVVDMAEQTMARLTAMAAKR
jgi:hypothetical protein